MCENQALQAVGHHHVFKYGKPAPVSGVKEAFFAPSGTIDGGIPNLIGLHADGLQGRSVRA